MQNNIENKQLCGAVFYTLLALISLGMVFYLFYYDPVNYVALITEDRWGEYGTSVSFAIAGILLLLLSFKQGPYLPRIIWALIGVAALFIAGEEISWGQRILGVATPDSLKQYNVQGEITFHNLEAFRAINNKLHKIAAYLILIWSSFSVILAVRMQRMKEKIMAIGLPVIPLKLLPMFLLVAFFFMFYPTAKADEVGEFFLGIAVMMWGVDLFLAHYWANRPDNLISLSVAGGALLIVAFLVICLTHVRPGGLKYRLNLMASRDYPNFEMDKQAQVLYEYIYLHPHYIQSDTRKNHAEMLLKAGKQAEASQVLLQAAEERTEK